MPEPETTVGWASILGEVLLWNWRINTFVLFARPSLQLQIGGYLVWTSSLTYWSCSYLLVSLDFQVVSDSRQMHSLCSLLNLIIMLTIKSSDDKTMCSALRSWTSLFPVLSFLCNGLRWLQSRPNVLGGHVCTGGHQYPMPVLTPRTCSVKRQGDLANAQQDTNKVDVVSRLTLIFHLNITGTMVGSVQSRSCAQIFYHFKQLWCADTAVGAQSLLAGRKAGLKTLLLALN